MAIEIKDVEFTYSGKPIIKKCSFTVEKGRICCLLGRNGSGKTTILRLINGLLKPQKGSVFLDGIDLSSISQQDAARVMGLVPQEQIGAFHYSVLEMTVMGRAPHLGLFDRPKFEDYRLAEAALKMIGIDYLKDKNYMEISGGERQLVLIARAIVQDVAYFLMDEPTSHLDFTNQHGVLKSLRHIVRSKGCGAVVALHDPNLALTYADEIIMIDGGKVVKEGPVEDMITEENLTKVYGVRVNIGYIGTRKFVYI